MNFRRLLEEPIFMNIVFVFTLFILIYVLVWFFQKSALKLTKENSAKYKVRKLINFFGYLVFVIGVMFIFNSKLSGLGTALGVAGAGITFALQEIIVSIAGYIAVFSSNFYSVGDRVKLGGIKGDVIDIGILRTTLMEIGDWVNGDLYNGKMVRVANSFVFKEPVYNYSGDFPFLWDEIIIPIKTNGDYKYAKVIFTTILEEEVGNFANLSQDSWNKMIGTYSIENASVKPMVTMTFDENWITFTLRYAVDYKSRRGTKSILFDKILSAIKDSEGKIEVGSAAFEITSFPNR